MSHMSILVVGLVGQLGLAVRVGRRSAQDHAPICDPNLVEAACGKFPSGAAVRAEDIAESFLVSQASATAFLQGLGLGEEASCQDLCASTVASLPKERVPPASDVGCLWEGSERVCDIDLSETALAAVAASSKRPQRNEVGIHKMTTSAVRRAMAAELMKVKDESFAELQIEVANWFRVWPLEESEVRVASSGTGGPKNQKKIDSVTKANLATTMQKLSAGSLSSMVKKWFGDSNQKTVSLVRAGVKHIQNVMKKPFYINHPNEKQYYGWVYSPYKQASNGTYPIHLGGAYFSGRMPDQVGTLTHEATHFHPLHTDDHIYCNVKGCLSMAKNSPKKALDNADHWSFFIDDVAKGGMR